MASTEYEAALEVKGALQWIGETLEAGVVGEQIERALDRLTAQLAIANQLAAYQIAGFSDKDEIAAILKGRQVI